MNVLNKGKMCFILPPRRIKQVLTDVFVSNNKLTYYAAETGGPRVDKLFMFGEKDDDSEAKCDGLNMFKYLTGLFFAAHE